MIKCNVTASGAVSRSGETRTTRDGKPYLTFVIAVSIAGRNGETVNQYITVYYDKGDIDPSRVTAGRRVEVTGTLTFKKRGESLYVNLSADTIIPDSPKQEDAVKGSMEFRGGVGRQIEAKTDKNGKPMLVFSAFSAEKVGDTFEYVWVRFIGFGTDKKDWLEPKSRIEASGELELTAFNGRISIGCRLAQYRLHVNEQG